jgi:hypothetical protein
MEEKEKQKRQGYNQVLAPAAPVIFMQNGYHGLASPHTSKEKAIIDGRN